MSAEAGCKLAKALAKYRHLNPIIVALPLGGVAVAAERGSAFHPLDIILVRKIGAPAQPELAVGAIVDGKEPVIVRNPRVIESTATDEETFTSLYQQELKEIERRRKLYVGGRASSALQGRRGPACYKGAAPRKTGAPLAIGGASLFGGDTCGSGRMKCPGCRTDACASGRVCLNRGYYETVPDVQKNQDESGSNLAQVGLG